MFSPRHLAVAVGAAAIVAAAAGCGSTDGTSTGSPAGPGNAVVIKNFAFMPSPLMVTKGTTVTWNNTDPSTHRVAADNKSFDSGDLMTSGTFAFTFTAAGTYAYHCAIHNYMTGTIVVTG